MFRPTPAVVTLAGPPGIGKSFLLTAVCTRLIHKLGISPDSVFSRNIFTEHWDGYYNQPIIVYDDVHCDSQHPSSTTFRELISLVSCMPFAPSYAHLENKGDLIRPKYILMSTNFPYPRYQCSADAIQRRSGLLVYCIPKIGVQPDANFSHLTLYALPTSIEKPSIFDINDEYHYNTIHSFQKHPYYQYSKIVNIDDIVDHLLATYVNNHSSIFDIVTQYSK